MTQATDMARSPRQGTAQTGQRPRATGRAPRMSMRDRYSTFVGFMKLLLPALAAALILLVIAWPEFTVDDGGFRLSVSRLAPDQADSLTMLNARFDGLDEKNRPYTLTADMATQSDSDEDLIELELPKADITLEDGAWLALTARSGKYRQKAEILDLIGSVSLFHDQGFELRTEAARLDLAKGVAEGNQPVQGQGSVGFIEAEGFRVLDRGARIIFTGKAHMIINPENRAAAR
jgi:lipopolysaccharide export system protein LptC